VVVEKKSAATGSKGKKLAAKHPIAKGQATHANHANQAATTAVTIDRRESNDRRNSSDRRQHQVPVAVEHRTMERRVKVNRRRQIDPTTCERDYTTDEVEFMAAMDAYKHRSGRMFPTCSEVLEVIRELGYVKQPVMQPAAQTALPPIHMPIEMSISPVSVS
jgi:hypothetical protein